MSTLRLALVSLALGLVACGEKTSPPANDLHECLSRPNPWECGSPGTYCGDKGPCPDAGVCESYRCVWPTSDGGP